MDIWLLCTDDEYPREGEPSSKEDSDAVAVARKS